MKFELEEFHRNVTDEELIKDLLKVSEELGKKKVTSREYLDRGKYAPDTLIRRLGKWNAILEKAGLEITSRRNISDDELFQNIKEVWIKFGRQPHTREMIKPFSKFSGQPYYDKFGSWRKALQSFIKYVNNEEIITEKSLQTKKVIIGNHKTKRDINWRLRFLVMRRDNFKCKKCGRSPATDPKIILHVDHIEPWSKGYETVFENLQTLCSVCNIGKSNLDDTE